MTRAASSTARRITSPPVTRRRGGAATVGDATDTDCSCAMLLSLCPLDRRVKIGFAAASGNCPWQCERLTLHQLRLWAVPELVALQDFRPHLGAGHLALGIARERRDGEKRARPFVFG